MRELERNSPPDTPSCNRLAIVGRGRLGYALSERLTETGLPVLGPLGRGALKLELDGSRPSEVIAVLLCVPDDEIEAAAAAISTGPMIGHCSGAAPLDVLAPHEAFSLHPLMTFSGLGKAEFAGAGAAVAGTTQPALRYAQRLADRLGLVAVEVAESSRPLYHAAASMASNFLLTLEEAAEHLASLSGLSRGQLVPLVRKTVENWGRDGARESLTGPIARGDERTVEAHRAAIRERSPELLELYDVLVRRTRSIAGREHLSA